ncbi:MAG TPA: DUF3604 domain-containing protein [Myxococcota bacterium]
MGKRTARVLGVAAVLALAPTAAAGDAPAGRCASFDPLRRPFFGDVHIHTRHSLDAATQGTRNGPRDAYRFARGEPIGVQPYGPDGAPLRTLRLRRPLDFAAVTDHAELFGEVTLCESPGQPAHDALLCRLHRRWPRASFFVMNTLTSYPERPGRRGFCGEDGEVCRAAAASPWQDVRDAAEEFQDRSPACTFTTFVGYEWTAAPGSDNLHRNVLFRSASVPALPISYVEEPTPEGLWAALERECLRAGPAAPGCDVLVIPHNPNLSNGRMFALPPEADAGWARTRAAMEPLVEIMQHKGDSECRPGPGVVDEQCGFEKLPYQNFAAKFVPWLAEEPPATSFVRDALKRGLAARERLGANPFAFGFVAGTDTHLAAGGLVEESAAYPGHGGAGTPAAGELPEGLVDDVEFNPGGLAVLWAEENSREALFAAMRRREAYGTSGPRIGLRVFAGWALPDDLCERDAAGFAAAGYAGGVPMGGVLPERPAGARAPRFAVRAWRDPDPASAPLQRIQIVKGWLDAGGALHERVIDLAGDASAAGVDPETCALPAEPDGAATLCAVWDDPEFDPAAPAFWYVRVLEVPTCRWHAHACRAAGVDCAAGPPPEGFAACCDAAVPRTIQERAWASPIWSEPQAKAPAGRAAR